MITNREGMDAYPSLLYKQIEIRVVVKI